MSTPMVSPHHVLARAQFDLAGYVFGWTLHRDRLLNCHRTFDVDFYREEQAAMEWAERILGTPQNWQHIREGGQDRWTANETDRASLRRAGKSLALDTSVIRSLESEPGTLVVAVGPAGSGKTTYSHDAFVTEAALDEVICLDDLRHEIGGDAGDQSVTPAAVARQTVLLEEHLSVGTTAIVDSTNVEVHVRAALIQHARRHGRPIIALRFLPPLDTCRARNADRPANRQVPADVLAWQHSLALAATPKALIAEGFTAAHDIVTPL